MEPPGHATSSMLPTIVAKLPTESYPMLAKFDKTSAAGLRWTTPKNVAA